MYRSFKGVQSDECCVQGRSRYFSAGYEVSGFVGVLALVTSVCKYGGWE